MDVQASAREGFGRRLVSGVICASMLLSTACADLPTSAAPGDVSPAMQRNSPSNHENGLVDVVCATSRATPGGAYAYEYGILTVRLPASTRAENGSMRSYRFRSYAEGQRVAFAADCRIPNTEAAFRQMNRRFGVKEEHAGRGWKDAVAVPQSGEYVLGGLEVNACRNGGEWPECEPGPITPPGPIDELPCWGSESCGDGSHTPTGGGGSSEPSAGPGVFAICVGMMAFAAIPTASMMSFFTDVHEAANASDSAERELMMVRENGANVPMVVLYQYRVDQAKDRYNSSINALRLAGVGSAIAVGSAVIACAPGLILPTP